MNEVMYSSKSELWGTPQYFFDELNKEFGFDLDPCALPSNAKCDRFFTPKEDGLSQNWGGAKVFCNPPYGKDISKWVRKSYEESKKPNTLVVMLLPARTDTAYFHDYIYHKAEIRFVRGRLHFNESKNSAPFPSMVVIFREKEIQE